MATQLKQTDFYTPTAPRPNIHVAFSAGPAAIAVRETLAGLPEADRTLDEIAAWTDGISPEMHALLVEADQRHIAYNAYYVATHQPAEERSKQAQGTSNAAAAEAAYDAINDEFEAMVDLASDAQSAVCRHPAMIAADLRAKLAFMKQHKMADGMNWTNELLADAERISAADVRSDAPDLPVAVRHDTSNEEVIAAQARDVIAEAQSLLSPAMYAAFLRWGEAASHFSSAYAPDEEGERRMGITLKALHDVSTVPAGSLHDYAFKAYLLALEVGDCSCFGPLSEAEVDGDKSMQALAAGTATDRAWMSPLPARLDELSQSAWDASATKGAFSVGIGAAITSAFTAAIESDPGRALVAIPETAPGVPAGYNPFMRGPLIQWQRRYAQYEQARDALLAYDRDVHTPTFAQADVPEDVADSVQARFDALLSIEHDAIQGLYRTPAPSAAELAIKLQIFERQQGWELGYASDAIRQITIDARRHGRLGAYLETDAPLLDAFAARRHEFEESFDRDIPHDEEAGYFARLDAAEGVVCDSRATTLEGVIAKLRIAFMHQTGSAWADRAILDPSHPEFVAGLADADMYTRMKWSAIEDLARIGGVNLSEQGR